MEHGQYSFEVAPQANKIQIKAAVEQTFNVQGQGGQHDERQAAQEVAHCQPAGRSHLQERKPAGRKRS